MNHFNFHNNNKELNEFEKEALKKIFSKNIKVSFLFKTLYNLKNKYDLYERILNMYNFQEEYIFDLNIVDLTICNHIVGIHSFNTLFLNEKERVQFHSNSIYLENLCKSVYEQALITNYDKNYIFKLFKMTDTNYLYFPPIYSMYILSKKLFTYVQQETENTSINNLIENTKILLVNNILNNMNLIFIIIQNGYFDNVYPLLRQSIETFVIYLTLKYSNINLEHYLKFQEFKINYDTNFKFDEEFVRLYENSLKTCSIQEYLNYGWIDEIIESYYIQDRNKYTLKSLLKLADSLIYKHKGIKEYSKDLYLYYQKCHYYTHSKLYDKDFEIIKIMECNQCIYELLKRISIEIEYRDDDCSNIDILKYAKDNVYKFNKLYSKAKNMDLKKYYNERAIKHQ